MSKRLSDFISVAMVVVLLATVLMYPYSKAIAEEGYTDGQDGTESASLDEEAGTGEAEALAVSEDSSGDVDSSGSDVDGSTEDESFDSDSSVTYDFVDYDTAGWYSGVTEDGALVIVYVEGSASSADDGVSAITDLSQSYGDTDDGFILVCKILAVMSGGSYSYSGSSSTLGNYTFTVYSLRAYQVNIYTYVSDLRTYVSTMQDYLYYCYSYLSTVSSNLSTFLGLFNASSTNSLTSSSQSIVAWLIMPGKYLQYYAGLYYEALTDLVSLFDWSSTNTLTDDTQTVVSWLIMPGKYFQGLFTLTYTSSLESVSYTYINWFVRASAQIHYYLPRIYSLLVNGLDVDADIDVTAEVDFSDVLAALSGLQSSLDSFSFEIDFTDMLDALSGLQSSFDTITADWSELVENITAMELYSYGIYDYLLIGVDGWLDAISTWLESINTWGSNIYSAITSLDLSVDVDVETSVSDGFSFWELVFGTIELSLLAASLTTLSDTLHDAFPFCLIFIVVEVFTFLCADAVAPAFSFDLQTDLSGSISTIEVDLSDFDGVASLMRGLMTVLYALGLFSATKDWLYSGEES